MEMKAEYLILFLCTLLQLASVAVPASVIFEDCGSAYELRSVNIEGCGMKLPCYVTLGDDVPVGLEFYASEYMTRSQPTSQPREAHLAIASRGCAISLYTPNDELNFLSRNLDQDVVININHINLRTQVIPARCEIEDCPVRTDMVTSFNSTMSVPTSMALNQRGYLRWRIENEMGQQVLCYSVLVQTQSKAQKLLRLRLKTKNSAARIDHP